MALAAGIALLAQRARALSQSGAVAATVVGAAAMAAGWRWAVVLIAYFVSSSLLSRFRAAQKEARMQGRVEKHGPRDASQVFANGGVYATLALAYAVRPSMLFVALGAGALAASAADTWATEIGALARTPPRSILGLQTVAVGTSGGVTLLGLAAGLAGGVFVGLMTWFAGWPPRAVTAAFVGGFAGCLLDSLLGASLQARYWCATCATATEQRRHHCGMPTSHTAGLRWLNNDVVNFMATAGGAVAGALSATPR